MFFRSPTKVGVFLFLKQNMTPPLSGLSFPFKKGAKIAFVAQFAARGSQNSMSAVNVFIKKSVIV